MMEPVEFGDYPYPDVDNSSWALTGAKNRPARVIRSYAPSADVQCEFLNKLHKKYQLIADNETEWEEINTEDADIILVSFGSPSRNAKSAMRECRKRGIKVGLLRPITLFPFPSNRISELADSAKKFISVEINMGQMIRDIKLAVNGKVPVELLNRPVGNPPSVEDIVERIIKESEV